MRELEAGQVPREDPMSVELMDNQELCANDRAICSPVDKHVATTSNRNLGAFIQDTWQIKPNLTINLGLRWESQVGFVADELAGENLSRGGIFVKTVRLLPQNAVIRLSIEVPGTDIVIPATCRVAFVRGTAEAQASGKPAGMGLELLDIADDKRKELERILAERKASLAPPPESRSDGRLRVIVVDDDIDARDWTDVMWAISTRMDPVRDITLVENTPIDYLDFASPESGLGGKMGLDATNKLPPETSRAWGRKIAMDPSIVDTVTEKWPRLGLPGSGKPIWK